MFPSKCQTRKAFLLPPTPLAINFSARHSTLGAAYFCLWWKQILKVGNEMHVFYAMCCCLSYFTGFKFIMSFIRGLNASAPRLWYASLFAKPRCRCQPSRANSKVGYNVGNWQRHLPYEERLTRLVRHSLQRRRLRADLITAFTVFKGLLDIDLNLFFLPPARRGLTWHPFKALHGVSHRRRRRSAFSVRVVKYWNKLPASVVTAPSVTVLKKRLGKVWTEIFSHLLHWRNTHPTPLSPAPPLPTCKPPKNNFHLYMLPNSLLYICALRFA